MVANLSADDMMALGRYFERQKHPPEPVKDPALAAQGSSVYHNGNKQSGVAACASCHGAQAQGTASLPRLAGQFAAYTENQLKLFSKRERTNDNAVMHAVVEKMTPQEMAAVAEYLSGK
jgi:cytochrome c553